MRTKAQIALLLASLSLIAHGAEPEAKKTATTSKPAQPDIGFLEYLGTFESDGDNWTDIATTTVASPKDKDDAKAEATAKPAMEKK